MKGEKIMKKRSKVLALMLCATMLLCAMPIMGFAAVSELSPIEINGVLITQDSVNTGLVDVVVSYTVYDTVGDQMTLLATVTSKDVNIDGTTGQPTNIAYIDQVAKPAAPAQGSYRTFNFKVDKASLGATNTLYAKVGGTAINAAAELTGVFSGGGTTVLYGDVNNDTFVDASDASLVLQYFVGNITSFPGGSTTPADVNNDTFIDASDASLILQKFVGNIAIFPIEQ